MVFDFYRRVMKAASKYTVLDYGFFKFLMITFGILLGSYFPQFFSNIIWLVWAVFIISAIWMVAKIHKYSA